MKNYIANESHSFETSSAYVRKQLLTCIQEGRKAYQSKHESPTKALMYLGAALHTLEDFAAHSNYVELALRKQGVDAFPLVGDGYKVTVPGSGLKVPPLVTGTFGMLDILQSLLGEVDDKASHKERGELDELIEVSLLHCQSSLLTSLESAAAAGAQQPFHSLENSIRSIVHRVQHHRTQG